MLLSYDLLLVWRTNSSVSRGFPDFPHVTEGMHFPFIPLKVCICVRMVIFVGKLSWHRSVVMHGECSLPEWASPRNLHSNAKWCQREGPSSSWGQIPRETWWVSLVWLLSSVLSLHALFHGWCFFFFFFLDTGLQGEMKLTFLQSFFF